MIIITNRKELRAFVEKRREQGKTIGLVPTMGALHDGHLSLVREAVAANDLVIVSDFVNPTQFNDEKDYERYPRSLSRDQAMLGGMVTVTLFAPDRDDIYSLPFEDKFDFGHLDKVMEGAHRPGHFDGVAQIVGRLFRLIEPDNAYFGEKDYQQLMIVKSMVKQMNIPTVIVGCPIVREIDGLALSSRNQLLSPESRAVAPKIKFILERSRERLHIHGIEATKQWVIESINAIDTLTCEYFEVANAETLLPETTFAPSKLMGFIAVDAGGIRLIDNVKY